MPNDRDTICYTLLMQVFRDNAYASIALNEGLSQCAPNDKPYVTKLFYGVLERNVYYDYVLEHFAQNKPKKAVATVIKMGYYLLEKMRMPDYAAVHNTVSLCKKIGKSGVSGFVNSALRAFAPPPLPMAGTALRLSVEYSYPLWLCERLIQAYGYDFTQAMLAYEPEHKTHIRVNESTIAPARFIDKYVRGHRESDGVPTESAIVPTVTGYYVPRKLLENMHKDEYVVQSLASTVAAEAYTHGVSVAEVLDLCAAPGGKAVFVATHTGASVTACDIHPHRVEMIRKYAFQCNVRIRAVQNDATVFRPEWESKYDAVLCDVPCSGLGLIGSKPDILFNRSESDIAALAALQAKILQTAARYVKPGGRLCYSTCTIMPQENDNVVSAFLAENENFVRISVFSVLENTVHDELKLFPHIHGTDGFFVTIMQNKDTER